MVFVTTSGGSLCINLWKDGLKPSEIVIQSKNIHSVLVIFPDIDADEGANDESILDEEGLVELFQVIANDMPKVRSITVSGGNYSQSNGLPQIGRRRNFPPLHAITSLLSAKSGALLSLCLVQIRMLGSDWDMRNFINAIWLHPMLQIFDCTGCVFEQRSHVRALKESCQRKNLVHFILDRAYIPEEQDRRSRTTLRITASFDDGVGGW
eukprot:CAMPEP_0113627346 /NCGR_PEP_ID=MMETSP0017_2-20120614/14159_1 /TAXON_ID=2856 /ORGANISM="Cylindrotheca closterium" /LENGTH=208 /DNA_ID=CAMNT_0000537591 /DNA_START=233 /DNA_END=856 /DNA_ORIENTATION=- /assembly_acc=CAM_ASM_000147